MPIGTPHGTLDYKQVSKVTFVGASSNTVIDTTTGSLGVGVGVGGPTSNLHVVGDALITGNVSDLNVVSNVNMLHTANTASIKLNSNVVAEFPRSKKLIKYPRVVIASGQSGLSGGYTQDGYTVKVSNESSTSLASYAFNGKYGDNDVTNAYWYTGNLNTYNGTPTGGYYVGTVNLGSDGGRAATVSGDWIELELPNKIKLEYFKYFSQNNSVNGAQDGVLYARNTTNEDWTLVHSYTDALVPDQNTAYTFNVNSTNYYKIYALVLTRKRPANTGTGGVAVGELEYFGVPEYDPEAHGTDVTVKSYPNVPNTDWLEVYYDAKDLDDGDVTNVDDLTPSGINDGTATNVTVSDGAFVFDGGTTTNITTTTATGMGGDNAFSISLWFNPTSQVGSVDNCLVTFGNKTSREQFLLTYNPNKLLAQFFGNGMNIDVPGGIQFGRWYHVVLTYPGGGHYNMSIYADGIKGSNNNGGTNLSGLIPTNAAVELGKYSNSYNEGFNGSIANFRLFNRVLTTDEIYQLYAYQKEDFGHSTNNMTLKAGRLGIGTSEPKAALDVRGRITREYNPGEIIETIQTRADGQNVRVLSGTYSIQNVTSLQDVTLSHTIVNGSSISYKPPPGTTRVIYEFYVYVRHKNIDVLIHFAGRLDGTQVSHTRSTFRSRDYEQQWVYNNMTITIGDVGSDNLANGKLASWTTNKTIDFTCRDYHGDYEAYLHGPEHWDGGSTSIKVTPFIKITAIA